jgi:hypothetical protein
MTHDPLCTTVLNTEMSEAFCDCALIARVREDERKHEIPTTLSYAAGLSAAREAVVEVHRKWGYPQQLIDSNVIIAAIDALKEES